MALADAGFSTLEEVAYVTPSEFNAIEGLDDETIRALQENARKAIAEREEKSAASELAALTALEGIDEDLARKLIAHGIKTPEELADQATDDLVEIEGLNEELAGKIIMSARNECWFKEDEPESGK